MEKENLIFELKISSSEVREVSRDTVVRGCSESVLYSSAAIVSAFKALPALVPVR
jgi:hypothetical protein